jgi:hypothetical protein
MFPRINSSASMVDWTSEVKPALFNSGYTDTHLSAINSFFEKHQELNMLIIDPGESQQAVNLMIQNGDIDEVAGRKVIAKLAYPNVNDKLMNLVLLGYVSSVEGYMRQIIRDLVNLDLFVREKCELRTINFGATYFQQKEMFPESLMDEISFASKVNIIKSTKELLDLDLKINTRTSLSKALNDFDSICHLRHCVVHRFGKIGVTNAIKLGMHDESYRNCLEKPISMNFMTIQKVAKVAGNVVKELNQVLWQEALERLAKSDRCPWKWDYRSDKRLFNSYVRIFQEGTHSSENISSIFKSYKEIYKEI